MHPFPQPYGFAPQQDTTGLYPQPAPGVLNLTHYANGNQVLQSATWTSDGTLWTAYIDSPVWDIRVEWTQGEQVRGAGVSLLGVGTLGINRYLGVALRSPPGASPPASIVGLRAYSQEAFGLVTTADMFSSVEVDRTTEVQSGGRSAATNGQPQGGSLLQFSVPIGARFWRVRLRLTYEVALGAPPTFLIDMASN